MGPLPSLRPGSPEPDGSRLARMARRTIAEALGCALPCDSDDARDAPDATFDGPGASFVTLTQDGELQGCVGGLAPHPSLAEGVRRHALAAAFDDPRFEAITSEQLPRLSVEVSLLSPLRPVACASEADLLQRLRPEVDGLVLEAQGRTATFLPQVWESLPAPADFLAALKRKAGLASRAWPAGTRAWTYTTEAWRDEPRTAPPRAADFTGPEAAGFLFPARHWHRLADGRLRCDVCPHGCALREGQHGRCFLRQRKGGRLVLAGYGRTSGLCVDPIEKKPLHHFLPGSKALSFGAVGCNLSCRNCQNWHLSRSRDLGRLHERAAPESIATAARRLGCLSVAFTYNEPAISLEFVSDVAEACHAEGIATVAVTAGYLRDAARRDVFERLDAANVDLKFFREATYRQVTGGSLQPVLDTLRYLVHGTDVWTEITTLLIPGLNDSEAEIRQLSEWIADDLGVEVPLHFSAFHPDHRMLDVPPTPPDTLRRARALAREAGLKHVYIGNIHDPEGATTYCPGCDQPVIRRAGFGLLDRLLDAEGRCERCGAHVSGRFDASAVGSARFASAPGPLR
ncbi:MAG: Radical Pyruvate-formate lyase-activating enzyme [Holophagaceae bacterium]|nr:Radical Pyruvate-formate lyase-activating enzyme [Holophagaceae bacterium]